MLNDTDTTRYDNRINKGSRFRKWSRWIHRDLSYFFAGILLVYCVSGVYMNHRDTVNVHHKVKRVAFQESSYPSGMKLSREEANSLVNRYADGKTYTQHYYPSEDRLKIFIKGGSSLELNQQSGEGFVEILSRRPIVSDMVKLHYNPGRWWTWFSDAFAISMILVVITGFTMMKGRKGFLGRGGILMLIGILVPIFFLLLS